MGALEILGLLATLDHLYRAHDPVWCAWCGWRGSLVAPGNTEPLAARPAPPWHDCQVTYQNLRGIESLWT
jgi:hypothetical protein